MVIYTGWYEFKIIAGLQNTGCLLLRYVAFHYIFKFGQQRQLLLYRQ